MQVLIIGGTGFLSSAIVHEALSHGHDVTIVTRGSATRPAAPPSVTIVHADRTDAQALRTALTGRDFDLVVDAVLFQPTDAQAAVDLFAGRVGRYVFISTDFVYGGEPRTYPIREDAPRRARNAYGAQKAAAEDVLFGAHAAREFPAAILRPPHILGAGSRIGSGSLEGRDPWLPYRLRNRRPILLLDGGELLIQPVHRTDIARACLAVAASDGTPGRAYNVAGPDAVSTRRYYEIVCELLGLAPGDALNIVPLPSSAYVAAYPDRAPFTQNRIYALDRLRQDTGFAPTISLRDMLAETLTALEARGLPQGEPPAENPTLVAALRDQASILLASQL